MKLRIVALVSTLFVLTSCFTTLALTAVALSNIAPGEKVKLSGRTIEQIPAVDQAALMRTSNGDTVCIVCDFKDYKDNQRIRGKFVRGGLYQYTGPDGAECYAPIFIRSKDFHKLWWVAVELDVDSQPPQQEQSQPEVFI